MSYLGKYGVSTKASQNWTRHTFVSAAGTIAEGDPEQTLVSGSIPLADPSHTFLIKVAIFGDSPNTVITPNLIFRLLVDGVQIATDNLAAPTINTETWFRGFSEESTATPTGLVEVLWSYASGTPGAQMNVSRATLLIEEVAT